MVAHATVARNRCLVRASVLLNTFHLVLALLLTPTQRSCSTVSSELLSKLSLVPLAVIMPTGPPELEDAIKDYFSYDSLPTCGIFHLLFEGRSEHSDYTWGFRIYRTTYNQPDSDAKFAEAIEVLNEYIRFECFQRDDNRPDTVPPDDGKANEQLWQHLRNEIVEDRELLEGASETPSKILELAQHWVHFDRKAKTGDSPRYRFHLVIDDEVIDHLLQLPMPAARSRTIASLYSVKVFDARHNSPPEFSGGESEPESDHDSDIDPEDEEDSFGIEDTFEGFFWSPANHLAEIWFCEHDLPFNEIISTDDSWNATLRFVHSRAALELGPWLQMLSRKCSGPQLGQG